MDDGDQVIERFKTLFAIDSKVVGGVVYIEDEISEVRLGPIESNTETFTFKLRGVQYKATQSGRLRDLCLGHSDRANRRIAVLAIADGLARSVLTGLKPGDWHAPSL